MKICEVLDCTNAAKATNLCNKHYLRKWYHGEPTKLVAHSYEEHGMTKTREYKSWESMRTRCYNPNCKAYKNYGGRGIAVCDRWRYSFTNFYADMGPKPTPKHTLERIDVNLGYEPSNCKWATYREQRLNQRRAIAF